MLTTQVESPSKTLERVNAYSEFQRGEGIPVVRGFAIEDLKTLELGDWARKGGRGAYVNLEGTGGTNDAYVCEIPPGGSLNPERHLFEEMIYVVSGSGSTSVWYDEARKRSFEWHAGSLFAIPLNAQFQHFNASGRQPARFLAVTNAPVVINLFHNLSFVFDSKFAFDDRFAGQEEYFDGKGEIYQAQWGRRNTLVTNFIADTHHLELYEWRARGAGGRNVMIELAHNTMAAHISEFPVGTYKKAHRHGPGAHVIILSGQGYSLLWPQGKDPVRCDWQPGSVVVPPNQWFHQHFNAGAEPARYLALRWGSQRYDMGAAFTSDEGDLGRSGADVSVKEGGWQIEYGDEDPDIHRTFEAELATAGAACRMKSEVVWCTGS
ncbi:MAG TPA: cupin domain-containing protein [Chloroflexota bacterium]|jgi:quercetin dioxygenase-like cupin family protein